MLEVLARAVTALPALLDDPLESWESLDVDYEPPRVERLWRPYESQYRLMLHRIHPCETALYHPHPWPSAVKVVSGQYEMGVSGPFLQRSMTSSAEVAKIVLFENSTYQMLNPYGWHYVKPLGEPSLSIMVTGKPFDPQVYSHEDFGKKADLKPLTDAGKINLLRTFRRHLLFP